MIEKDIQQTVKTLYERGKKKKEIARLLCLDPGTVRKIIANDGEIKRITREDKKEIDKGMLEELYKNCNGYAERMYEILTEEYGKDIGYSTLTRLLRENGIGFKQDSRCAHVDDVPGEEMQHDTAVYIITVGTQKMKVICSGLYFRYSKIRYIKFYARFNRFTMKCFIHEALSYWKYACKKCIIDNTNLAVLYGTGKNAVIHPEMIVFARKYGFEWIAHEKGHANRKAGKERNFWTVETNFFPGRSFNSIDDLNKQAFEWAAKRYAFRPVSKSRIIPIRLFEDEKPYLYEIPEGIHPPYQPHHRTVDEYGYCSFNGNYFWIPGKSRVSVKIIEYSNELHIYQNKKHLAIYTLPAWNVKNKKFCPQGAETNPYQPRNRKKPCHEEETYLRNIDKTVSEYIDFIKSKECRISYKPKYIRNLYYLSRKVSHTLFLKAAERALKYQAASIETIERIITQLMKNSLYSFPDFTANEEYKDRAEYQEGRFSRETGVSFFDNQKEDDSESI